MTGKLVTTSGTPATQDRMKAWVTANDARVIDYETNSGNANASRQFAQVRVEGFRE